MTLNGSNRERRAGRALAFGPVRIHQTRRKSLKEHDLSAKDAKDAKESEVRRTSWLRVLALFASFASFADKNAVRNAAASLMRE